MTSLAGDLAEQIRRSHLGLTFGILQVWGTAVMRANDQSYELISAVAEGERLDLGFIHESHSGTPGVISLWAPSGLEPAPARVGQGMALRQAERIAVDDVEAVREGERYWYGNARGRGVFAIEGAPALVLAR